MSGGQDSLWAFGDSFTFGSELPGERDEFVGSDKTWQGLLAADKGLTYRCIARGGASNDWIARNVLKCIDSISNEDLIIIQWTYNSRAEFPIRGYVDLGASMEGKTHEIDPPEWKEFEDSNYFQTSPNLVDSFKIFDQRWAKPKLENIQDSGALEFNELYYKKIHSEDKARFDLLRNILFVEMLLKGHNFYFSFVDNIDNSIKHKICKDRSIYFDDMGFDHWCTANKLKRGRYNHPLEEAHRSAFKYVKENYNV